MTPIPTAIELFCGCGGLSTGFLDAGFRVAAGFDINQKCIEAYEYNHAYRGSRGILLDVAGTSGGELLQLSGQKKIDLIIAGPPCQPFSIVGKRRGVEDDRAHLVFDFLRLVKEIGPQAVVFENVPNLATIEGGDIVAKVIRGLRGMGYQASPDVLLAANYGVPQMRRRLFVVAARDVSAVTFPTPSHDPTRGHPYVTARDALDDLPLAAEFGECGVHNHEPTEHTEDMLERFSKLPPGKRERSSFHDRLHPDRPSFTLRAGTGNFSPLRPVHYRYDRVITARESARLQGFGDSFIWPDWIPRLQQYRQVGNAVPPPLAEAVGKAVAKMLGWKLDPSRMKGHPENRPSAITLSDEERRARRRARIRGASLGLRSQR